MRSADAYAELRRLGRPIVEIGEASTRLGLSQKRTTLHLRTLEEAGLKGYELSPWFGIWYPAGAPAEYVTRVQTEVAKVVKDPSVRKNLEEQGMEGVGSTPHDFEKTIADELVFFKKLTTRMGVVPQ